MAWNDGLIVGTPTHQIAATTHPRVRVLAGPGTGKSFAMKRRVARLLEVDGIDPQRILAVTFTRVAAEDLHRELISLGVPGANNLNGRTLHSLAMSILMRNHVLRVLGRHPRPLNDFEKEPMLADLHQMHGNKHVRRRLIKLYGAAWARLQTDEPGFTRTPEEQAFVDELISWLIMHEAMLMDEVVPHLLQYLRSNPGCSELSDYTHLLIDEYQDLNRAEQEVLQLLGRNASMCVIGDDDQSIYSFKHAHPEGIREWINLKDTEQHSIDECWRCPNLVVRMANTLISHNPNRLGTVMLEMPDKGTGEVVVRQFQTAGNEASAVARKITELINTGVEPREIIVLAQRKVFANPIYRHLRDAGVPVKSYYAESSLDNIVAQERFAILKLLLNHEDRVALRWLIGRGKANWHSTGYRHVMEHVRQNAVSPWVTLIRLADGELNIPHTTNLVTRFREIQTELQVLEGVTDIDSFLDMWLPTNPDTDLLNDEVLSIKDEAATIQELFEKLSDLITQPDVPEEVTQVRVMSLHKSKGLSSPYVFIVGCIEGLLPSHLKPSATIAERESKLQEDRRLFYVGITRVKSKLPENADRVGYLALTYSMTMPAAEAFNSQINPVRVSRGIAHLQASRFLGEMAPHVPAAQFTR